MTTAPTTTTATTTAAIAAPPGGLRAPCPCGSGKRYKQCHGRIRTEAFVARPLAGLSRETDFVALRELVPAATMSATTVEGQQVVFATVLPMGWAALRRPDATVWVGVQTTGSSSDLSRDLGAALAAGLRAAPGATVESAPGREGATVRLHDLLAAVEAPRVHQDFGFWIDGLADDDELGEPGTVAGIRASLDRFNEAILHTEAVSGVDSAFWVRMGGTTFVRWVVPFDEDEFMTALARLHVTREAGGAGSALGDGTRFAGAFRAHGLLVPVWDLSADGTAASVAEPLAGFAARIAAAMAETAPLNADERRARAGLMSRQVTLR